MSEAGNDTDDIPALVHDNDSAYAETRLSILERV
jgi:hypothetical protein